MTLRGGNVTIIHRNNWTWSTVEETSVRSVAVVVVILGECYVKHAWESY